MQISMKDPEKLILSGMEDLLAGSSRWIGSGDTAPRTITTSRAWQI